MTTRKRKPAGPARVGLVDATETTIEALQATGRLESVDAARIAAFRTLAAVLENAPDRNSMMWAEYRAVEARLREGGKDDDDALDALVDAMRTEVRDEPKPRAANPRSPGRRSR